MSFKIIVGMKFEDLKHRKFLVTDVYHLCDEEGYLEFALTTKDGYNIHFRGPSELQKFKKIGFVEIGKDNPTLIVRSADYIFDLEKKQQIKFTNPS